MLKLPLLVLCIMGFSHLAFADNNLETFKVTTVTGAYNSNFDLKMDTQEQIAYLSTITQGNNGNKKKYRLSILS